MAFSMESPKEVHVKCKSVVQTIFDIYFKVLCCVGCFRTAFRRVGHGFRARVRNRSTPHPSLLGPLYPWVASAWPAMGSENRHTSPKSFCQKWNHKRATQYLTFSIRYPRSGKFFYMPRIGVSGNKGRPAVRLTRNHRDTPREGNKRTTLGAIQTTK